MHPDECDVEVLSSTFNPDRQRGAEGELRFRVEAWRVRKDWETAPLQALHPRDVFPPDVGVEGPRPAANPLTQPMRRQHRRSQTPIAERQRAFERTLGRVMRLHGQPRVALTVELPQ